MKGIFWLEHCASGAFPGYVLPFLVAFLGPSQPVAFKGPCGMYVRCS